jgi:PBP1b-binding outer membrane lipoprotein LpoB
MANATMISIDEMYLKKEQAKKPETEFEKLSQQDLEDICN